MSDEPKIVVQYRIVTEANVKLQAKIDDHRTECAYALMKAFTNDQPIDEAVDKYRKSYMLQSAFNDVAEAEHGKFTQLEKPKEG